RRSTLVYPLSFFFLLPRHPPSSALFPYTTLFRSLDDRLDVRTLERALHELGVARGLRLLNGCVDAAGRWRHRLLIDKCHQAELTHGALTTGADAAVCPDGDLAGALWDDQRRAAVREDRVALAGDDLALTIELEMSVARVAGTER